MGSISHKPHPFQGKPLLSIIATNLLLQGFSETLILSSFCLMYNIDKRRFAALVLPPFCRRTGGFWSVRDAVIHYEVYIYNHHLLVHIRYHTLNIP